MTDSTLAVRDTADIIEAVLLKGDLAKLEPAERVAYIRQTTSSLGLNELTRPFDYISLNGKLTLYPTKNCTDQLRQIHGVSITRLERSTVGDIHLVTAYATDKAGRQDSSTGAVSIAGLRGDALANAFMKCETKAKRRVTLSLCGLGWTDESELETITDARPVRVDLETGEILDADAYLPTKQREVDDAPRTPSEMIRTGKEPIWQRWLELVIEAEELGLQAEIPKLRLPIARSDLTSAGVVLGAVVSKRKSDLADEAAIP